MAHIISHAIEHGFADNIKILPFLFLTYLFMEYLEKKAGEKTNIWLKKSGNTGPVIGALAGIFPQCGFSAVASNLYAGRVISAGTLIAIFLSTSDEMLPIMISNAQNMMTILKILLLKVIIAVIGGFLIDFFIGKYWNKKQTKHGIHEFCEHEHCHCEDGILKSSLRHTVRTFIYIFLVTIILNIGIELIGEETLGTFILNHPVSGPLLSGLIGIIPNCASSVVITNMYLNGFMTLGTMMAGLLAGAGVGILVLIRVNESKKESFQLILSLYLLGVFSGILLNFISLV